MAEGTRMQQRRATEAVWNTSEYVLAPGELGVTTDTGIIKIGNGTSPWSELDIALGSEYLPILGKAADSELLDGIDSDGFYKLADATTAATANKLIKRLSDGRAQGATATSGDDLVNYTQWNANNTSQAADITNLQVQSVADRTALLALSTGSLPYGYRVRQTDKGYLWMWDLTAWRYTGTPGGDNPYMRIVRTSSLSWSAVAGEIYGFSLGETTDSALFSWTTGTALSAGNGGRITVTEAGKYRIQSYIGTDAGSNYYFNLTHLFPSISSSLLLSKFGMMTGLGVLAGFGDITITDEGHMAASQGVGMTLYISASGASVRSVNFVVTRLPSI